MQLISVYTSSRLHGKTQGILKLHSSPQRPSGSRNQVSQRQIIDHILDLLDRVLDRVNPLPQDVVLEVQQLEPRVDVLDEVADLDGKLVVPQGDRVDGQAGQLVRQAGDGK